MPIKQQTTEREISQAVKERLERMIRARIYALQVVGEKVVNEARLHHSYTDQTGNLTSSIGYVIVRDGVIVNSSRFEVFRQGEEGAKQGRAFAEQLAGMYFKGLVLIVVAGKEYAKYVSARGYNVLDSAELLAKQLLAQIIK